MEREIIFKKFLKIKPLNGLKNVVNKIAHLIDDYSKICSFSPPTAYFFNKLQTVKNNDSIFDILLN